MRLQRYNFNSAFHSSASVKYKEICTILTKKKALLLRRAARLTHYENYKRLCFDFYFDTAGKFEAHESVDRLGGRSVDVEKSLIGREFELFT